MKKKVGEYFECSVCGGYKKLNRMAYIKPQMERDVFSSVDNLCNTCVSRELEKLTSTMNIPARYKKDARWIMANVFRACPNHKNVEKVMFLCSIILNEY